MLHQVSTPEVHQGGQLPNAEQKLLKRDSKLSPEEIYVEAMDILSKYDNDEHSTTHPFSHKGDPHLGESLMMVLPKSIRVGLRQIYYSSFAQVYDKVGKWFFRNLSSGGINNSSQSAGPETGKRPATRLTHRDPELDGYISGYALVGADPDTPFPSVEPMVAEAMRLLHYLGDTYEYTNALLTLAHIYLYGEYSIPHRFDRAFRFYHLLADKQGHPTAQYMVGWFYATGFGFDTSVWQLAEPVDLSANPPHSSADSVSQTTHHFPYGPNRVPQRNPSRAILYYTFAAHQGHLPAKMTIAYRYHSGTGSPSKCDIALSNYHTVARKAIKHYLSGGPGGRRLPLDLPKLFQMDDGIYGIPTEGDNPQDLRDPSIVADLLEYYRYMADRGDIKFELSLALVYYAGTVTTEPNFPAALRRLRSIVTKKAVADPRAFNGPRYQDPAGNSPVDESWPESYFHSLDSSKLSEEDQFAGRAAGILGEMYIRGDGVRANNQTAYYWLQRAVERGSGHGMYWIGMFYWDGTIVPRNKEVASQWFAQGARRGDVGSWTQLGIWYKEHKTFPAAYKHFAVAARAGSILSMYHMGVLFLRGLGVEKSCENAVAYFKQVTEQADWLYSPISRERRPMAEDLQVNSLIRYSLAAEMGYPTAQLNLAWLIEQAEESGLNSMVLNRLGPQLALSSWTRAANQGNADARVKMGDYYYYGRGTQRDLRMAASCYQLAAENQMNPVAMWNLGWMHENGLGVPQDFHLAKRCYDRAAATYPKGSLAVGVSLIHLYIKYYWAWLKGEDVGTESLLFGYGDHEGLYTADADQKEGIPPPVEDEGWPTEEQATGNSNVPTQRGEGPLGLYWRDPFGIPDQQQVAQPELPPQHDEPVPDYHHPHQVEGDHAEYPRRDAFYPDYQELGEDTWVENAIILGLCALIGWMMYVRQQRLVRNPNANNNANNPEGNNGERGHDNLAALYRYRNVHAAGPNRAPQTPSTPGTPLSSTESTERYGESRNSAGASSVEPQRHVTQPSLPASSTSSASTEGDDD
ncbi:ERAD-associated protein [Dispira parvispora]|uniref:ERAD-associated protein n=1 Tax=Dispira parvispora TaxID=1520584 RepID=A0A9W8E5V6_9FUNG|nr:ERAD-associated protein [Dispira parvispora]